MKTKIQALRGGGVSGNVLGTFGRAPKEGGKNQATEGRHARTGYAVSVDGSRFSCESRNCADVPASDRSIEQEVLWPQVRWLGCLSGHALFDMPAQQQLFVIRAAVYASVKSNAMLRASSHPAVMRIKRDGTPQKQRPQKRGGR